MKTIYFLSIFILLCISPTQLHAQRSLADTTIGTTWLGIQYGGGFPSGELAERYGYLNHVGIMVGYKTSKNWVFGMDANFLFGGDVRLTGVFDHLTDSNGNITDINGDIGNVRVAARGLYVNGIVGKVIPVLSPNPNSGILIHVGFGYLIHRMRIETQDHVVPQLELEYKKGYDRLSSGANVSQFVGYVFMGNEGAVNFYGGFYAQEGFTYNRRTINYDTPEIPVSTDLRIDVQLGFRVGWLIPIYERQPKEFYFD
ncbi:MAG: hypothetical protein ACI837_002658 [Crocinitomicaceae bacterium]|jgi:hypothetical protein